MQKVTITRVYWDENVQTSRGAAKKVSIKTDVHGDKWLSCFENQSNSKGLRGLQENQQAEIIVTQNGDFLNFRLPNGFDRMEERIAKLEAHVFGTGQAAETPQTPPSSDHF